MLRDIIKKSVNKNTSTQMPGDEYINILTIQYNTIQ